MKSDLDNEMLAVGHFWQGGIRFAAIALVLGLAGCATSIPAGRYQAFSAATQDVQAGVLDTDARIEKRQREFAVLTAPNDKVTTATFKPTVAGTSYDISNQLRSREAALDVLVKYAKTIESLAGKDLSSDVDKSAQNLAASLNALSNSPEANSVAKVIATITDGLSATLTERERKNALKNAMISAQPAVTSLSTLLDRDYTKVKLYVGLMRDRYVAHANADRPAFGTWQRYNFDRDIAAGLEEYEQIDAALASASDAVKKFPEAHQQLLASLDSKEPRLDTLREVIHQAQRMRGFYQDLPTN